MPEGDTLHKAAAALAPLLVGKTITRVVIRGLAQPALVGRRVISVGARAKHLLVELERDALIHVHLGIHGSWRRLDAAGLARVALRTDLVLLVDGAAVAFRNTPVVEVLRASLANAHPVLGRLGPDLVDPEVPLDEVLRRARAPENARRAIGELLLDQRVAGGIGNIYKSEVLFVARVHPTTKVGALDDEVLRGLYRTARDLLLANLGPTARSTVSGPAPQRLASRHYVYHRRGMPCLRCGTAIEAATQGDAARMTYWCPRCQVRRDS